VSPIIDDDTTLSETVHPSSLGLREHISLLVLSGPDAGQWFDLPLGRRCVVGRHPDAHVRLADPAVSREHCEIRIAEERKVKIRDLGSHNGTFIDGYPINEEPLKDGDRIQLSSETVLRVRFLGASETELMQELQRAASTDPLTGVANRRYLMSRLEQEISFARRHGQPVSVMMIDLDNFKTVNDAEGHAAGDAVLKHIADILVETVRLEDVVARYGGDEFAIIARSNGSEATAEFAVRLREAVAKGDEGKRPDETVTLSVGIASFDPDDPAHQPSTQQLLSRADAALYKAKREGRNRVVCWSNELTRPARPDDPFRQTLRIPFGSDD
jgi:diguanylate cyclase (GGDEF)-like protein